MKALPLWRPMADVERAAASAISPSRVRYPPGSPPKRFARNVAAQAEAVEPQITDKQAAVLWRTLYRFRRQVADKRLIAHAAAEIRRLDEAIRAPSPHHPITPSLPLFE